MSDKHIEFTKFRRPDSTFIKLTFITTSFLFRGRTEDEAYQFHESYSDFIYKKVKKCSSADNEFVNVSKLSCIFQYVTLCIM